jgi:uncharacterized protein (DUF1800 family)
MRHSSWLALAALVFGCAHPNAPAPAAAQPPAAVSSSPAKNALSTRNDALAPARTTPQLDLAAARHVLNRFAFGPRAGESEALVAEGFGKWLDAELAVAPPAPALDAALAPYREALAPPSQLLESWLGDDWMQDVTAGPDLNRRIEPYFRDHLAKLALAEVTRHVLSEHQLEEVMVDFWANHFNVFARKGLVRVFAGDYVERAVRPYAFGRFEDLLLATAHHPAMLIYLDNAESSASKPHDADPKAKKVGLNENYARELLELHTLGVDGGYSQHDVTEVARILTGFSVMRPQQGGLEFVFRKGRHDAGEKTALGETFPAGHGEDEGVRLLKLLAAHPATAKHLAQKLCALLVADEPPPSCVEAAARAYRDSNGEIRQVVRAIASDASFWSPAVRGSKLKTPLEFAASALRAIGAKPDGSSDFAKALQGLGEPLLEESVPTGYPDAAPEWASSSGMLARMSFATSLALGKVPGVTRASETLLAHAEDNTLVEEANRALLAGSASERTLDAVTRALEGVKQPERRRELTLALLLGSPEFQRQ